jgi:hypothetical protein
MFRYLKRSKRSAVAAAPRISRSVPKIENLETRALMSRVPIPLVAQAFVGTQEAITSVVLTFNVPLDPTTAQNPGAYRLVRKFGPDSAPDTGGFGGVFVPDEGNGSAKRLKLSSATYDPAANTVTLVPERGSFELKRDFTVLQVDGKGPNTVLTADGQPLDGDGNGKAGGHCTLRFKASGRARLKFTEADGDRVTVSVTGPGKMLYFLPIRGRSAPVIFLRDTTLAGSVLSGTVKKGKRGDGVADIAQISAASTAQTPITTDPAFRIRSVTP